MFDFFVQEGFLNFISYLLYALLIILTGWTIYLVFQSVVKERIAQFRFRNRLRQSKYQIHKEVSLNQRGALYRHIYLLLQTVFSKSNRHIEHKDVRNFLIFSIGMGVSFFILLLVKIQDGFLSLGIGGIISLLPYVTLQVKLRRTRSSVGNQITPLVNNLIHAYSASENNMYEALKSTYSAVQNKELRAVLIKLIGDLQTARDEEELMFSIELFIYTSGSTWGMRLGNIILKSYIHQENVLNALLQLQRQMLTNVKMLEEEKKDAYDVFANGALGLILFPVSLIGAYYITKPQNWFSLQFGGKWSLLFFIGSALMVVIGFLSALLVQKPKNDL